uniref:Mab-21 like 4 n=2 Tax=Crocodylus porosus TaxID=8502 RepID=A0A7M4ERT5_CROPO
GIRTGAPLACVWAPDSMAVKVSHWHNYLRVILSREDQRMEHFQRAENILLTVLEEVNAIDPRFLVDYSRNLEAFEFALCSSEDEVTVEVPLCLNGDDLLVKEGSGHWSQSGRGTSRHYPVSDFCYLGVPKEGASLENWTSKDVFSTVDSAECSGYIVPGKVLRLLRELIVAAIVHCRHQFLIQPGDLSAERLKEESMQLPLLVSSGWKIIQFNLIPVVRRTQANLKLNSSRWRERGFPEGSLSRVTQGVYFIPATYHHWRYSTNRPVVRLLHIVGTMEGHRLDSLRLLDQVNSEDWREEGKKRGLTFKHLEMVLLWATELFPSPEDWEELEGSIYRLLVILLCSLATKNLPHFLRPEENLFQEEDLDLSTLYHKVEGFASTPQQFLKFHFTPMGHNNLQQKEMGIQALLQLPAKDSSYWDTAFFDILLSKFQVYWIQDKQRLSAMSDTLLKVKKAIHDES